MADGTLSASQLKQLKQTLTSQYPNYKSPYGPKFNPQPNFFGCTTKQLMRIGVTTGAFGSVALFAVIFYASGIPRLQRDVLMKVPLLRRAYEKDIPASDNPF